MTDKEIEVQRSMLLIRNNYSVSPTVSGVLKMLCLINTWKEKLKTYEKKIKVESCIIPTNVKKCRKKKVDMNLTCERKHDQALTEN